jgi:hypothetical protein
LVLLLAAAAAVSQTELRSDFAARSQYTYVAAQDAQLLLATLMLHGNHPTRIAAEAELLFANLADGGECVPAALATVPTLTYLPGVRGTLLAT